MTRAGLLALSLMLLAACAQQAPPPRSGGAPARSVDAVLDTGGSDIRY